MNVTRASALLATTGASELVAAGQRHPGDAAVAHEDPRHLGLAPDLDAEARAAAAASAWVRPPMPPRT